MRQHLGEFGPPDRCTGVLPRILTAAQFFVRGRAPHAGAAAENALIKAVALASGGDCKYLLDPSKDFTRLMRLLMTPGLNVTPIYLVRDVRGVACSYQKPRRNDLTVRSLPFIESVFKWIIVHLVNRAVFARVGLRPIHISYAGLCENPGAYVRRLNAVLDIDATTVDERVAASPEHYIGGNTMKLQPLREIRHDTTWRASESAWRRLLYRVSGASIINKRWALKDDLLSR